MSGVDGYAYHNDETMDILMERIRQNSSQYSLDQFHTILKRKEKRLVTDIEEKNDLQKLIEKLKNHDILEDIEPDFHRIESDIHLLSSLVSCNCTMGPNGTFTLLKDNFNITIELSKKGVTCLFSFFGNPVQKSDNIQALLISGKIPQLAFNINRMLNLVPTDFNELESSELNRNYNKTCYEKLKILEADLITISEYPHSSERYALQFCTNRSESSPFTIILSNDPFLAEIFSIPDFSHKYGDILYSASLCMTKSEHHNPFPKSSYIKDKYKWSFAPYCPEDILPLQFSFLLSRPILVHKLAYKAICNVPGVSLNILHNVIYFQYLSEKSSELVLKLQCSVPSSEFIQQYIIEAKNDAGDQDIIIDKFDFIHPESAIKVLKILRDQLILNSFIESICQRRPHKNSSYITSIYEMELKICSVEPFTIRISFGDFSVDVVISDGLISVDVKSGNDQEKKITSARKNRTLDGGAQKNPFFAFNDGSHIR